MNSTDNSHRHLWSFPMKSVDGYDSFITFTDDYFGYIYPIKERSEAFIQTSRFGYIYPIKERSEALDKLKIFKAEVEKSAQLKD